MYSADLVNYGVGTTSWLSRRRCNCSHPWCCLVPAVAPTSYTLVHWFTSLCRSAQSCLVYVLH